jgi:iron complex outermembrane receptor protein
MGGPPRSGAGSASRPGGGGFGRGFGPFGGNGGRWSISAYHTIKFVDEVDIAPGVPTLDLLGGDATGQSGGTPRQSFEVEGGWFNKGIGVRMNGAHQTATSVNAGGSRLHFSDLTTLNLRLFVNFDQRKSIVQAMPLLKGARLAIRIDNVFNDIQDVRDAGGLVPLRYQPGYIDPVGRTIEISLRKIF